MLTVQVVPWRSQLERQSSKREVVGSSPTVGKSFSFCNSRFLRVLQSFTNETENDIHLANTLF